METFEYRGTYGSGRTPCTVFVAETGNGRWYCVEGSKNINHTHDAIYHGVDVETLSDNDTMTAGKEVNSVEELVATINS